MRRPLLLWLTFACFLALALGAMGWMTRTVLRLEDLQARATSAAQVEENVRLALWRMDYALSPLISQETARPYFEYSPVFPAEQAYTRMYTQLKSGDVLVPSPLLRPAASSYVLLYFQVEPDGRVTSPQAPSGEVRRIAQQRFTTAADIQAAEQRLEEVRGLVNDPALTANLPPLREADAWSNGGKIRVTPNGSLASAYGTQAPQPPPPGFSPSQRSGNESQSQSQVAQQPMPNAPAQQQAANPYDFAQQVQSQQLRGQQEYAARARNSLENVDNYLGNNAAANFPIPGVSASVMQPVWAGADTLILARQVSVNGRRYVQGCLLDWPAVRKWLLDSAADLVPGAELTPVRTPTDDKQPRMLASIPARLVLPAEAPAHSSFVIPPSAFSSPTVITLLLAWSALLLAACAVALLLRGVIALSQRRAGFVSAVTHELRTPLTTLRMYTEMLADGMVADPEKQASYHKTLRAEANRLGHLVDNVLLYSRLERSARDTRVESARLGEVLDRLTPRLADRAGQAGMAVRVSVLDAARGAEIRANLLSVEQILFNLVDNACKYAATAADRTIDVTAVCTDGHVAIRVTDHGPGLDAGARARLFKPFSKSVHEAANTAPGLGLGLALSYRLARNMNARLELDAGTRDGAAFVLTLPAA